MRQDRGCRGCVFMWGTVGVCGSWAVRELPLRVGVGRHVWVSGRLMLVARDCDLVLVGGFACVGVFGLDCVGRGQFTNCPYGLGRGRFC